MKNLQDEKESVLATNKSLAEYNLSKEPTLAAARVQLASSYTRARQLNEDFQTKVQKLSMRHDIFSTLNREILN